MHSKIRDVLARIVSISLIFLLISPLDAADNTALDQRVVEHTCANGIKLLILERHFSPTVAVRMMFRAGAVDETSGKTGLAHMFEHMMFKGTPTLGTTNYKKELPLLKEINTLHQALDAERLKGERADAARIKTLTDEIQEAQKKEARYIIPNEMWNLYEREGASELNAETSHDFTQYMVDLPSNKLELWAMIDSDRVKHPVFRQFYSEREVVKEERRMRVDTNADGKLYEEFIAAAFIAHPYRRPTIGWESDLDHLTVDDLQRFYERFYTPDQLTIAIVGDVKSPAVIHMVDHYFGDWDVHSTSRPIVTVEPPQTGPRRITIRFESQPDLVMAYHIPTAPNPDHVFAFALSQLLTSGTTSRLYKALVEKTKIATSIDSAADEPGERYDDLLIVSAAPRYPHTSDEVERAITREIERLKTEPVASWEMEKLRAAVNVSILDALETNAGMAGMLAYDQSIFGDWKYLLTFQKQINAMTSDDLQKTARKYLSRDNLTVGVVEPTKKLKAAAPAVHETLHQSGAAQ